MSRLYGVSTTCKDAMGPFIKRRLEFAIFLSFRKRLSQEVDLTTSRTPRRCRDKENALFR